MVNEIITDEKLGCLFVEIDFATSNVASAKILKKA